MLGIPGNRDCLLTAYKSEDWAPLCKKFASDTKIYSERPPDGALVPFQLTLWLLCSLMRADISWEEQSTPGKTVGPKEPQDDFIGSAWRDSRLVNAGAAVSDWAKWTACVLTRRVQRLRVYPLPACTSTWLRVNCSRPTCWCWIHSWFLALGVSGWPSFRRSRDSVHVEPSIHNTLTF